MENRDTLFRNFILYWFLFFQHGAKVMFVWLLIVLYFLCVESPPSNLCCYSFSIQVTHQTSFYTVSYSTKQNLSNPLHTTIDPSLPKLISKSILHYIGSSVQTKVQIWGSCTTRIIYNFMSFYAHHMFPSKITRPYTSMI